MEFLNNLIREILLNGNVSGLDQKNITVTTDENGDFVVRYKNPANQKDVKEIKNYLDELDDDILQEAAAILRKDNIEAFNILNKELKCPKDVDALKKAFETFKLTVKEVVKAQIKTYSEKINSLYDMYLKNEE